VRIQSEALWQAGHLALRTVARCATRLTGPRIFVNSVPKSGTHLARSLLWRLPGVMFSGVHVRKNEVARQRSPDWAGDATYALERFDPDAGRLTGVLSRINDGQVFTAHLPFRQTLLSVLQAYGCRSIFLIRDPRDVIVSYVAYVCSNRRHHAHRRYLERFRDRKRQMLALLEGCATDEYGPGEDSLGVWYRQFLPWLAAPGVLVVRFESLVGPRGNGDLDEQIQTTRRIADHVGHPLTREQAERVARKMWSTNSVTFRRGRIGDWSNHFDAELKETFKAACGQWLIDLGYERTMDW
jgi:hypothetical protein